MDSKLIPTSVEMRHQNVSIITAKMWSEAPVEQKKHFNEMARIEKEEHMKKYVLSITPCVFCPDRSQVSGISVPGGLQLE